MSEHVAETRSLRIAFVAYATIFVLLLVTYFMTNILLMLAQSLEVLSDVLVSSFLLISLSWSQKPADRTYMFGRGRAQNVAALVSATIFISFMSLEVFRQALEKFFSAEAGEFQNVDLPLMVILVSMLVLAIPMIRILKVKKRGASAKAELVQLVKDEISYVPTLVGLYFVGQGYNLADPLTSMIIGAVILFGGLYLFKDNFRYLVGKAPSTEFMAKIKSTVKSVRGVLGVHDLAAEYVGSNIVHTGFHIEVARGTSIEEADRISEEVHEKVMRETGCQHCVIHVDPVGMRAKRSKRR